MYLNDNTLLQGGKYRITNYLGSGGFGVTYLAEHVLLGKKVCIKEFFPAELCNRDVRGKVFVGTDKQVDFVHGLLNKFINEARILSKFNDIDGIVRVNDVFSENDTAYYVMDFIDGQNLDSFVSKKGRIEEGKAVDIIKRVCGALSKVHERKCLHLDIKPGNIMITPNGDPILIDFGVAKQYDPERGTNTSTLIGYTQGYAPLEQQSASLTKFSPATDVYALAATLYTLISGKVPPAAADMINGVGLTFPADISQSTRKAIEAGMQMTMNRRPQSVESFIELLSAKKSIHKDVYPIVAKADKSEEMDIDTLVASWVQEYLSIGKINKYGQSLKRFCKYLFVCLVVSVLYIFMFMYLDPWNRYIRSKSGFECDDDSGYSMTVPAEENGLSEIMYYDVVVGNDVVVGIFPSNTTHIDYSCVYGLCLIESDGKYGLCSKGKLVLPVEYEMLNVFGSNSIIAYDGNWNVHYYDGAGNEKGKDIVMINNEYGEWISFGFIILGLIVFNSIVIVLMKRRKGKILEGETKIA